MLHILWMVIKFILILLGIVLGLLLLAILLVLFCPVRYYAAAEKLEDDFKKTKFNVSVSWLFHGVWVRLQYQEGKLGTKINLLGIPIHKILEWKKAKESGESKSGADVTGNDADSGLEDEIKSIEVDTDSLLENSGDNVTEAGLEDNKQLEEDLEDQPDDLEIQLEAQLEKAIEEFDEELNPKEEVVQAEETLQAEESLQVEETWQNEESSEDEITLQEESVVESKTSSVNECEIEEVSKAEERIDTDEAEVLDEKEDSDSDSQQDSAVGFLTKIRNILDGIAEKLRSIGKSGSPAEKVAAKIQKIKDKVQDILDKINWWKTFLTHPKVKAAVSCVKKAVIKLLKHIMPTRLYGNITIGSEDPATTGTILALLGITMPFHKNCIEVTPLFDGENVLTGKVQLKGRIYVFVLLFQALKVIINKNVRYTIKYWKNKEEA